MTLAGVCFARSLSAATAAALPLGPSACETPRENTHPLAEIYVWDSIFQILNSFFRRVRKKDVVLDGLCEEFVVCHSL